MDELANYIVTHQRPSSQPGRVAKLRLLERRGEQFEDCDLVDRQQVIDLLADDERLFVWDQDQEELGQEIELVRVQGEHFLRLDGQQLRADNLGDLPQA
jgi:hypothetical protein